MTPGLGVQRCPDTEKPGDVDSGWLVVNRLSTGRVLVNYGSWRRGERRYSTGGDARPLTPEEQSELDAQSEQFKSQRQEKARLTAIESRWIWEMKQSRSTLLAMST